MLRHLVSKQTYMVIMTIGCLFISTLTSAENALCLDVGDVPVDVPIELNSCHLDSEDCSSTFIQEQRNTTGENDCEGCFDFTFQDAVLTGIPDRDTKADLPPITTSFDIHLPRLIYVHITNQTHLRRNETFLPALTTEKSIKSTVLII